MTQTKKQAVVEVTRDSLPMHCPLPDAPLWDSHPRVYIPLEDSPEATCPYCGTVFRLVDDKKANEA